MIVKNQIKTNMKINQIGLSKKQPEIKIKTIHI